MTLRLSGILIMSLSLLMGCGGDDENDGSSNGTVNQGIDQEDYQRAVTASQETGSDEEVAEVEADASSERTGDPVEVTAGIADDFEGDGDPELEELHKLCGEDEYYNACEECVCVECAAYASACADSEGCMAMINCSNANGCIGPACYEACSEVVAEYGIASKDMDLGTKFAACASAMCFETCIVSGGIGADPYDPEDGNQGEQGQGGNNNGGEQQGEGEGDNG